MADINFQPLFEYLDAKFGEQDKQFTEIKASLNVLQTSVDSFAKTAKDTDEDDKATVHRLEEVEGWVGKAAVKVGVPFKQ